LPAGHPLVAATLFLAWVAVPAVGGAAAGARVALATCQMLAAFSRRCRCSRIPADQPRFLVVTLLRLGLTAAAWDRILGELVASGLLRATFASLQQLHAAIDTLTIATPANLVVGAGDLQLGEPLALPAPAVGGRRRGSAPMAAPALPPAVLSFLDLASILELELPGGSPWAVIDRLAGMLGPCLTVASRAQPSSCVQLAAACLAGNIRLSYAVAAGDDHSVAGNLRDYVHANRLPERFQPRGVEWTELRTAARDAFLYGRSVDGRRTVEQSRIGKGKMRAGEDEDDEEVAEVADPSHSPHFRAGKDVVHGWAGNLKSNYR